MIGYYNYTVILTYLSLLSALYGTHLAMSGNILGSLVCLMMCGVFDSFDGIVARSKKDRTEEEKMFGIQIDSLVDLYSFGVFPTLIGYAFGLRGLWFIPMALYPLGAVIRLGYFNVVEEIRQQQTTEKRKYYQGLPVTASCLAFPLLYLLKNIVGVAMLPTVFGVGLFVVALLFIIDFKVVKPGLKGVIGLMVLGCLIFAGLMIL